MIKLEAGTGYTLDIHTNHSDHAAIACYQPANKSDTWSAAVVLISQMYSSDLFNDLRTNQQLGYIAAMNTQEYVSGITMLCFGVESAHNDSAQLWREISKYCRNSTVRETMLSMYLCYTNSKRAFT